MNIEVAVGAKITAKKEAAEFDERMENGERFMTTSCCPAYTETVKKHLPALTPFVSRTRSPMFYTAQLVKEEYPDAITVFIGPCVAKRNEALFDENVDYVISAEELGALLVAARIEISDCRPLSFRHPAEKTGRGFPLPEGVIAAVRAHLGEGSNYEPVFVDGLNKKTILQLGTYVQGRCPGNFIEVMGCKGGCVAGPGIIGKPAFASRAIQKLIESTG